MTPDFWAKEAERLQRDETLNRALETMRLEALSDLVGADADNKSAVIRAQERVKLIDEFRASLDRMIMASNANPRQPGSFA